MSLHDQLLRQWSLDQFDRIPGQSHAPTGGAPDFDQEQPPLPGSPERCITRRVVVSADAKRWVLERITKNQAPRREAIARLLAKLHAGGLRELAPYVPVSPAPDKGGFGYVLSDWGQHWQLSPFIRGKALPRPEYLDDADKGAALGRFLGRLKRLSRQIITPADTQGLAHIHLPQYVADLNAQIATQAPELAERTALSERFLTPFFEAYAEAPQTLCHGDTHPLNIIWGAAGGQAPHPILAVIDWEFAGMRPELFDLAVCLGCLGVESADAFERDFAQALLTQAHAEAVLHDRNIRWLQPLVLCMRFAWLSEWLRKKDQDMVRVELEYMDWLRSVDFYPRGC